MGTGPTVVISGNFNGQLIGESKISNLCVTVGVGWSGSRADSGRVAYTMTINVMVVWVNPFIVKC